MRIALLAAGDATRARTWSGVPKRVLDALTRAGHTVVPLNIYADIPYVAAGLFYNRVLRRIVPSWRSVEFFPTRFLIWLSGVWFKRMSRRHGPFDAVVCTTFSIDCLSSSVPVVLLHDWTEQYDYFRDFRPLNAAERRAEENQLALIRRATRSFTLYPNACAYIRRRLGAA